MKKEDIIYKALKDPKFKRALEENPKKILEKEFGQKLSNDVKIKVIEEKPNEITLVIPKISNETKITDNELKQLAGGTNVLRPCCSTNPAGCE